MNRRSILSLAAGAMVAAVSFSAAAIDQPLPQPAFETIAGVDLGPALARGIDARNTVTWYFNDQEGAYIVMANVGTEADRVWDRIGVIRSDPHAALVEHELVSDVGAWNERARRLGGLTG